MPGDRSARGAGRGFPIGWVAVLAAALGLALAGCGGGAGGGGGDSSAATASTRSTSSGPPASAFHLKPHHDSGGGSAQFILKGADNSVQEFGEEASESELHSAAAVLHGFLDARAARNWRAACSYLSGEVKRGFTQFSKQLKDSGCAAALAALSEKVPTSTLAEAAVANVGALRFEGDRAFVIYRGVQGTVFAISMEKQGGAWKVGSLSGVPLG